MDNSPSSTPDMHGTPYSLFDTHAHYDDDAYDADRDEVLRGLASNGVAYVVNVGYDIGSSVKSRELSAQYWFIRFAAGIHPHDAAKAPRDFETDISELLKDKKAAALGEIGLDYHYDFSPRDVQREIFERQLALAGKTGFPVVIHDREAHSDVIDILRAGRGLLHGGIMHCFSGDVRLAGQALDLGLHIAFGGALTFKNSSGLAEAAAYTPADRLLLETDSPYMSPVPFRGKRNDSTRLRYIIERMAQIRAQSVSEIAEITTANAKKLFGFPD